MVLKYGVVQGRLLPQVGDFIQNFPDDWREEFKIAKRVGASHIEWIDGAPNAVSENKRFWSLKGLKLEVPISGICLDWLVSTQCVTTHGQLIDSSMLVAVAREVEAAGIKRLVLPLLENASLYAARRHDESLYVGVIDSLRTTLNEFPSITFSIETDLDVDGIQDLLTSMGARDNLRITFDMGNLTKRGYDLHRHITTYGSYIDNVHIKDCIVGGTTVPLGTGDTDLSIMRRLVKFSNIKDYTFQTARNPGLSEEDVFRYNVATIERILNENR